MERHSGLLNKAINVLNRNRSADLYMQRYMTLFNSNHKDVLEHGYRKKVPGKLKKPNWPPMGKFSHPV